MTDKLAIRLAAGSGPTFGVDDLACAAATSLGFWEEEGLDVTWTPVHGGVAAMQAVLDGRVDVAYGGLGPVIRVRAEGHPCRVAVSMARGLAQNLVAQRRVAAPADLRGASWALDGFGALSHHMARLLVRALGIDEGEIDWRAVGPPPERIAQLIAGEVDVSLIRVEEAVSLGRTHGETLHTLLRFAKLKDLVPVQPHGVLATTEAYENTHGEELLRLVRGIVRASRALHDDYATFRKVYDHHVTVPVPDDDIETIWRQEHDSGGFAVNGELSAGHWREQMALFSRLNPELRAVSREELIADRFVTAALRDLGVHAGGFDRTGE